MAPWRPLGCSTSDDARALCNYFLCSGKRHHKNWNYEKRAYGIPTPNRRQGRESPRRTPNRTKVAIGIFPFPLLLLPFKDFFSVVSFQAQLRRRSRGAVIILATTGPSSPEARRCRPPSLLILARIVRSAFVEVACCLRSSATTPDGTTSHGRSAEPIIEPRHLLVSYLFRPALSGHPLHVCGFMREGFRR